MKKFTIGLLQMMLMFAFARGQMKPFGPVPSPRQQAWQEMEFYLFLHFGPNTFTDLEWGKGTEREEVFNPSQLDCRQWCRIAKAAGAKGLIITAKHHDGFCLWPSKFSKHTVAQSKWRGGHGDVLKELAEACHEYGLKLGIYLSPWDRNHPQYGTASYNEVFINMMKEVVSKYGPLFEFWWDGANGEGPNGKKQIYDWHRFEETMRSVAPNTPVFSDTGPDIRWVGNEQGFAGITNWNMLDTVGFTRGAGSPPTDTLNSGNSDGKNWIPAECDVSIRPGWFYHSKEDGKVKTPEELFLLYLKSVGRGASLLLNVPPDTRGLISAADSAALVKFRTLRNNSFGHPSLKINFADSALNGASLYHAALSKIDSVNCIMLTEAIEYGQRIKSFTVMIVKDGVTVRELKGTTIGRKRIITFPAVSADAIVIRVDDARASPVLSGLSAYRINNELIEK